MKATADLLVNGGYAAVLALGDEQYNSGKLTQFQQSYDPSWGRIKSRTYPVPGNHEYGTSGAAGYFDYFGSAARDRTKGYYSFNIGSWHVLAINSNCTRIGGCGEGSPQEEWVTSDLAASTARCTLAFWHHPRFNTGHEGEATSMIPIWDDLYNAGAELVLSGHAHDYERFVPMDSAGRVDNTRGMRQFVVGTGGAFFTGWLTTSSNSVVRQKDTFGILELRLSATGYTWRFVPEAGKSFSDSGSATCH
jgi:hypothetical protein